MCYNLIRPRPKGGRTMNLNHECHSRYSEEWNLSASICRIIYVEGRAVMYNWTVIYRNVKSGRVVEGIGKTREEADQNAKLKIGG